MVKMPFEKKKSLTQQEIDKLINKGAPVKGDIQEDEGKKWTNINLRMPVKMLKEIDKIVSKNVGFTRTGWILQAIQKEIKKMITDND